MLGAYVKRNATLKMWNVVKSPVNKLVLQRNSLEEKCLYINGQSMMVCQTADIS